MDETYDLIILGTGLKETILSALLQKAGKKILNIDRNRYYGGEAASLLLDQLYTKLRGPDAKPPEFLGDAREWSVDLCPKFLMASGILVNMLRVTRVTRYMEMALIPGSYIASGGAIHKVPATASEALSSSLLGLFEKRRFKNMLQFISAFDPKKNPEIAKMTARQFFASYSLSDEAVEFTGHAIALHTNNDYLDRGAVDTILKIQLYEKSLARFGKSPFIYPQYGLGTMSEGFSRLCAINGGLQMLEKQVQEIVYEDDKVVGIKVDDTVIKAGAVLADPTYVHELLPQRVKQTASIIHSIVFMDRPVPNTEKASALQLVIPAAQAKRRNDIYCAVINHSYSVCANGWYIAVVSTVQEKPDIKPEEELVSAYSLLGGVFKDRMTWTTPYYVPQGEQNDGLFITESQDPTTHFEYATQQVLAMYKQIIGEDFDFNQPIPDEDE